MFTECSTKTLKIFFLVYFIFFFFTDAMKATWLRFVFIFFSFINYCSLDAWSFASDLMTRIYVGQFAVVLIFYYTLIYYRKKIYTLTSLVCFHKCIFRFLVLKKMVVIWNFTSGHFFFVVLIVTYLLPYWSNCFLVRSFLVMKCPVTVRFLRGRSALRKSNLGFHLSGIFILNVWLNSLWLESLNMN